MSRRINLKNPIYRGDTHNLSLLFKEGESPYSIEGRRVVFVLKRDPRDTDEQAVFIQDTTIPAIDALGAAGQHHVVLHPSDTQLLEPCVHYYEVRLVTPDTPENNVYTFSWGTVCCEGF